MREIEVKLKVDNLAVLATKLQEQGCELSEPIQQHDVIYSQKMGDKEFISAKEGDILIRIRHLPHSVELNLKQQRSNEMDNLEYETEISNPKAVHDILEKLGWFPVIEVKKTRRKGLFKSYEICLDQVQDLGNFVELEKLTDDDADPNKVRDELFQALESLGLNRYDEETKGYDTQMYRKQRKQAHNSL